MSTPLNATAASILGLLMRRPMSGWELSTGFGSSIGSFWSVTRSQIYREIQTLGKAGFIVIGATGARDRRICTITPRGEAVFRAWIELMPGDELIRFPLLLMTFFGDVVPAHALKAACVAHREAHARRLAAAQARLPEIVAAQPFPALTLQFGIAYEQAVLAWIDALPWMASG